jgi:5-methylcytosine-specific restriction endonuclease McrA
MCPAPCTKRAVNGTRYCSDHQTTNQAIEDRRFHDRYRADDPIRKLYRTPRWKATRRTVIHRDILCVSCGHKAATEVDHILSARLVVDNFGVDEFYSPDRCQGLCHECHSSKTAHECGWTHSKGTRLQTLTDRSNTTVVCGAAGSGKTTYVTNSAQDGDLVWDYDVVMQQITGLPLHEHLPGAIGSVLADRDRFIESTAFSTKHVWIIVSNPAAVIVKLLRDAGAEVVVMDTPADICAERVKQRLKASCS